MNELRLADLNDNTARIKEESARNEEFINFFDMHTPVLPPAVGQGYSPPVEGQLAYHYAGKQPTVVTDFDYTTGTLSAFGYFSKISEWMSRPWTDEDRASLAAVQLQRASQNEGNARRTMEKYKAFRASKKSAGH